MSKCRYSVSAYSTFSNKSTWRKNWNLIKIQELSYQKGEWTYTLSNRYNSPGLMLLFKEALSFIIRRLSFNFNRILLFSLIRALNISKDGEWFQITKWSLTALPLGSTLFLVNGEIPLCSPILPLWSSPIKTKSQSLVARDKSSLTKTVRYHWLGVESHFWVLCLFLVYCLGGWNQ